MRLKSTINVGTVSQAYQPALLYFKGEYYGRMVKLSHIVTNNVFVNRYCNSIWNSIVINAFIRNDIKQQNI